MPILDTKEPTFGSEKFVSDIPLDPFRDREFGPSKFEPVNLTNAVSYYTGYNKEELEKLLVNILPEFAIPSFALKEKHDRLQLRLEITTVLPYNIRPFRHFIDTYFKVRIEKLLTDNESYVNTVLNSSLFSFDSLPIPLGSHKPLTTDMTRATTTPFTNTIIPAFREESAGLERMALEKTFGEATETQLESGMLKNFVIEDVSMDVNYTFEGINKKKPKYILYNVGVYFDFVKFEKDYELESLGYSYSNYGKCVSLYIMNNGGMNPKEYFHVPVLPQSSLPTNNPFPVSSVLPTEKWLGAINKPQNQIVRYSYSHFNKYSQEVMLLSNPMINNFVYIIDFTQDLSISSLISPKNNVNSAFNIHKKTVVGDSILTIFSIDWLLMCKNSMLHGNLLDINNDLLNYVKIVDMRIYREDLQSNDGQKLIFSHLLSQISNNISSVSLEERGLSALVRNFILKDDFSKVPGGVPSKGYAYFVEILLENKVYSQIEQIRNTLSQTYQQLSGYKKVSEIPTNKFNTALTLFEDNLNFAIRGQKENINRAVENLRNVLTTPRGDLYLSDFVEQFRNLLRFFEELITNGNPKVDKEATGFSGILYTYKYKLGTVNTKMHKTSVSVPSLVLPLIQPNVSLFQPVALASNTEKKERKASLSTLPGGKFEGELLKSVEQKKLVDARNLLSSNMVAIELLERVPEKPTSPSFNTEINISKNLKIENVPEEKPMILNQQISENSQIPQLLEQFILPPINNTKNSVPIFQKLEGYEKNKEGEQIIQRPIWKNMENNAPLQPNSLVRVRIGKREEMIVVPPSQENRGQERLREENSEERRRDEEGEREQRREQDAENFERERIR